MTYKVSGNEVVTDQPSQPDPQTSLFAIHGNILGLINDGEVSRFLRA
jgi:hypothetical protein